MVDPSIHERCPHCQRGPGMRMAVAKSPLDRLCNRHGVSIEALAELQAVWYYVRGR